MHIAELTLKNFKSYNNVTIKFNSKFNVIVGENNIGKSTIFEALQLWKKCYDLSIVANGDKFYSTATNLYINFDDLHFIRLASDEDIFSQDKTSCSLNVTFCEYIEGEPTYYGLTFSLSKPNIKNSYIRISRENEEDFNRFLARLSVLQIKLREFILIHQTSPISNVLSKEPYMYKGQVIKKIEKGKSDEVLRNKILQSLNADENLLIWMKNVLNIEFSFVLPRPIQREKDEYIKLLIDKDGGKLDIYLQGSGFLQVAEIFSTIKVMNVAVNILLIDEPDSHISPKIQSRLLDCLKSIENTQTFIVTHNDNFVSDVDPHSILFINTENKEDGEITGLDIDTVDAMHFALGGIITGLTTLQKHKKVFFLEGDDDISYIRVLNSALKRIGHFQFIQIDKLSFWYVRGKDDFKIKMMAGKQLLSQAVRDCRFGAIFDKDYSTTEANTQFIDREIKRRLGDDSIIHTHNGYCIESVLFSDLHILERYLQKIISYAQDDLFEDRHFTHIDVMQFLTQYSDDIKTKLGNYRSDLFKDMNSRFDSQKKPQRSELNNVTFNDYADEACENIQYCMNKKNIAEFVRKFEHEIGGRIFNRSDDSDDTLSSKLLINYFDTIENFDEVYPSFQQLISSLNS